MSNRGSFGVTARIAICPRQLNPATPMTRDLVADKFKSAREARADRVRENKPTETAKPATPKNLAELFTQLARDPRLTI